MRLTVWVLPVTPLLLSVMVRVPEQRPLVVGAKVTLMLQEPPAAILLPQLLVWEKSPLVVMPVTASAKAPVLDSLTGLRATGGFHQESRELDCRGRNNSQGYRCSCSG